MLSFSWFLGLPGVLWVLPDSYLDVPNKDYGGMQYLKLQLLFRRMLSLTSSAHCISCSITFSLIFVCFPIYHQEICLSMGRSSIGLSTGTMRGSPQGGPDHDMIDVGKPCRLRGGLQLLLNSKDKSKIHLRIRGTALNRETSVGLAMHKLNLEWWFQVHMCHKDISVFLVIPVSCKNREEKFVLSRTFCSLNL